MSAVAPSPGNPFADIAGAEFLQQQQQQAAATTPSGGTSAAVPASAAPAPTTSSSSSAPPPSGRAYNPHARLAELDPSLTPDDVENARLTARLQSNVSELIATKQANERKQQVVGSILAEKYKQAEMERSKLLLIRQELSKLDQSLVRNIDMLRQEIETVGKEVNTLQRDFDHKEKEYLATRKALAKVKQRKLLLTSHLDHIILTNENEKARKLQELEVSLGLAPSPTTAPYALPAVPVPVPVTDAATTGANAARPAGIEVAAPLGSARAAMAQSPGGGISRGASAAAIAAAAESERRHAAAMAAAAIPADHPGLRLDAVAPPAFGGFEEEDAPAAQQSAPVRTEGAHSQQTHPQHSAPPVSTNPFGPPSPVEQLQQQQAQRQPQAQRAAMQQQQQQQRQQQSSPSSALAAAATSRHVSMPPRNSSTAASLATTSSRSRPSAPDRTARVATTSMAISHLSAQHSPHQFLPDGTFAGFAD